MASALHDRIYQSQPEEQSFRVTKVSGEIPRELAGTVLRSGPGLMQLGDDELNFFDGHALIAGVTFERGEATLRARYVRTPLYEAETRANAIVVRHVFTNHPSRWKNLFAMKIQNTAMHDVYAWGSGEHLRVVASNDPGHFALDPRSLETRGEERWGGAAPAGCDMGAMPSPDANTGRLVGYVKKNGMPDALKFVELDAQWKVVKETPFHKLSGPGILLHDSRATARHYVATHPAFKLSLPTALWGAETLFDSFKVPPGAVASLMVVPRDGGALVEVPLPAGHAVCFHIVNAFDDGDRLVVDAISYDRSPQFSGAASPKLRERRGIVPSHGPTPRPMRFVVDPRKGVVIESRSLGDLAGEAPEIADAHMGKPYRWAYFPTTSSGDDVPDRGGYFYYGGIAKLDVERGDVTRWSAGDAVVSPCAFAPRPGASEEDDGWVITWVLRESGASVVVLDARDVAKGPVATLDLGVHLPGVSHVRWAPDVRLGA